MSYIEQPPLIDTIPFEYKLLEESINDGRKIIRLKGILSEGDTKNRNNRIYPIRLLERELQKVQNDISQRKLIGELDHPDDLKIHLDKVSHLITEAHIENNRIVGTIEVIEGVPCGDILAGLIRAGVKIGISSRAMGSVNRNNDGCDIVQEDFNLLTWDVVAQPSFYNAWLALAESRKLSKTKISSLEDILSNSLKEKLSKRFFN